MDLKYGFRAFFSYSIQVILRFVFQLCCHGSLCEQYGPWYSSPILYKSGLTMTLSLARIYSFMQSKEEYYCFEILDLDWIKVEIEWKGFLIFSEQLTCS
jgi:hypothetical protein